MILKETKNLFIKEIKLELRQIYVINGILLYMVSTIFVTFLCFENQISLETWNSLFWIILLFIAVNGISKSFVQESPARHLYYYSVTSPQSVILSKLLYNGLLMIILSSLCYIIFILMMGNKIVNLPLFLFCLVTGGLGLSSVLTMMAAIASRAGNNFSLMAILSFPVILPLLSLMIKISRIALTSSSMDFSAGLIIPLITVDGAVIVLAYLLFPYLWKD